MSEESRGVTGITAEDLANAQVLEQVLQEVSKETC